MTSVNLLKVVSRLVSSPVPPPPMYTHTSTALAAEPVKVDEPKAREQPKHGGQQEKPESDNQQGLPDPKEGQL